MFKKILDSKEKYFSKRLNDFLSSRTEYNKNISESVSKIIKEIRESGDKAVIKNTNKFDNRNLINSDQFLISTSQIRESRLNVDEEIIKAMEFAFNRILNFHNAALAKDDNDQFEGKISRISRPLEKVLIYTPGGKASYPSSVLMTSGPAKAAGVKELILTSPMQNEKINDLTLAAASVAGIDRVYSVGGVQALAAFSFGTDTFPKVNKIVGPGNKYVTEAKRQLFGEVGIDMLAGPSEIVIVADYTSNPKTIALDLMAQAEHDEFASAILISTDKKVIEETKKIINFEIKNLSRKEIIKKSFSNRGALINVESLDNAMELVNKIAPEHLHLVCKNAKDIIRMLKASGMVLVGEQSANALSDYILGPSHIVPTGGTARFSSPLSVQDFLHYSSLINLEGSFNDAQYNELIEKSCLLAEAEGFTAHAKSLLERKRK